MNDPMDDGWDFVAAVRQAVAVTNVMIDCYDDLIRRDGDDTRSLTVLRGISEDYLPFMPGMAPMDYFKDFCTETAMGRANWATLLHGVFRGAQIHIPTPSMMTAMIVRAEAMTEAERCAFTMPTGVEMGILLLPSTVLVHGANTAALRAITWHPGVPLGAALWPMEVPPATHLFGWEPTTTGSWLSNEVLTAVSEAVAEGTPIPTLDLRWTLTLGGEPEEMVESFTWNAEDARHLLPGADYSMQEILGDVVIDPSGTFPQRLLAAYFDLVGDGTGATTIEQVTLRNSDPNPVVGSRTDWSRQVYVASPKG